MPKTSKIVKVSHSAKTGKFVSTKYAEKHKSTTFTHAVKKKK